MHYIAPIASLPSICQHGLLCHEDAEGVTHDSVANASVQDLRAGKSVPQGLPLHQYANLYFDARNPMMSALRHLIPDLVVVRVDPAVLDLPGTVVTDGNAATHDTRFYPSPDGLEELDEEYVYAEWWTDPDLFRYWEKKRRRCAEVLVPSRVDSGYLLGCYVYNREKVTECAASGSELPAEVNRHVFLS